MTNVLPWFSVCCITSAHTKVLCSSLVSRSARSGVSNLLKSEIAEVQPSVRAFCLLGLPQLSVWWSEDFGNEKNLRGHRNTWREGPIKCLKLKEKATPSLGVKAARFIVSARAFYWCNCFRNRWSAFLKSRCLTPMACSEANEMMGARIANRCQPALGEETVSESNRVTERGGKTLLYECGPLCRPMCVWWRCSNWRWVWLTSSIRSVVEVWTAALPRYRDHRIQTTICQAFSFPPLLFGLKTFQSCKCNDLLLRDKSLGCFGCQVSLRKAGGSAFLLPKTAFLYRRTGEITVTDAKREYSLIIFRANRSCSPPVKPRTDCVPLVCTKLLVQKHALCSSWSLEFACALGAPVVLPAASGGVFAPLVFAQ